MRVGRDVVWFGRMVVDEGDERVKKVDSAFDGHFLVFLHLFKEPIKKKSTKSANPGAAIKGAPSPKIRAKVDHFDQNKVFYRC